jgi:hypothetical protein
MTHPISDPHGEKVDDADAPQDKKDVEIAKEFQNLLNLNHYLVNLT